MSSIRDVAKEAGVGVGTVSRALNKTGYVSPSTRKKIEKAAQKLEYTPNELARNIKMELYRQGYKTMICNAVGISDREREYLDMLERNMVDGIITGSHCLDGEEYLRQKKPIVSIDRDFGAQIADVSEDQLKESEAPENADIYEIVPEEPYSDADLNYNDNNSRTTIEMNDPDARPAISGSVENMEQYDIVFIGYPIWLAYHNLIQCTQGISTLSAFLAIGM